MDTSSSVSVVVPKVDRQVEDMLDRRLYPRSPEAKRSKDGFDVEED